jgi:hypothetical protein
MHSEVAALEKHTAREWVDRGVTWELNRERLGPMIDFLARLDQYTPPTLRAPRPLQLRYPNLVEAPEDLAYSSITWKIHPGDLLYRSTTKLREVLRFLADPAQPPIGRDVLALMRTAEEHSCSYEDLRKLTISFDFHLQQRKKISTIDLFTRHPQAVIPHDSLARFAMQQNFPEDSLCRILFFALQFNNPRVAKIMTCFSKHDFRAMAQQMVQGGPCELRSFNEAFIQWVQNNRCLVIWRGEEPYQISDGTWTFHVSRPSPSSAA